MKKILIVEDDLNLGTTLAGVLESQSYKVQYLSSGKTVLNELNIFEPDLIILDVMLNEELDGFDISKQIRSISKTPVLFTTSRDGNDDFINGFSMDNTDYVRKPYKVMEVLKRIEKLLEMQTKKESFTIGHFSFFPCEQSLKYDCGNISLNNYESAVLSLLCKNMGNFISKKTIIQVVWNQEDPKLKDASLNNILTILRKHLKKDNSVMLETRVGLGVRIVLQTAAND